MNIKKIIKAFLISVFAVTGVTAITSCGVTDEPKTEEQNNKEYTITLNYNYDGKTESVKKEKGTTYTLPTPDAREGYTFDGWYTTNTFDETSKVTEVTLTSDVTFYAKWTIKVFTITYEVNGGATLTPDKENYNTTITNFKSPTRAGYTFIGWYLNSDLSGEAITSLTIKNDITLYAKWEKVISKYTLSYSTGTEQISPEQYDENTVVTLPEMTREGYTFDGWYLNSGYTGNPVTTVTMTKNITVYAKWTIKKFTLTYNTNGGNEISPNTKNYNTEITLITPVKEGYKFEGWYTTATFDSESKVEKVTLTNDIAVYAKWTIKEYTLTYEVNGGTKTPAVKDVYNTKITLPTELEKEGYTFKGWYTTSIFDETSKVTEVTLTSNVTVYAKFEINTFKITLDLGITGEDSLEIEVNYGEIPNITTPYVLGKEFDGWLIDKDNSKVPYVEAKVYNSFTLYATWKDVTTFKITLEANGGTLDSNEIEENSGTTYTLPIPTNSDESKEFAGWYTTNTFDESSKVTEVTLTSDVKVYAKWTVKKFTLTYEVNGGTKTPAVEDEYNTKITLPTELTKEGYTFKGWYTTSTFDETSKVTEVTLTSNVTVYAKFEINKYTITLEPNGGSLEYTSKTYDYNTKVTLPTPTKEGYEFVAWNDSKNLDGATYDTFNVISDITLYAEYVEAKINVLTYQGGNETLYLYAELATGKTASDYKVEYSLDNLTYTEIDQELIRLADYNNDGNNDSIRADIVGLASNTYSVRISLDGSSKVINNIKVSEQDRSGYAHFNYSDGVGAYNDDGTLKTGAIVVYVDDTNKNTVKATIDNTEYTGLYNIINEATSKKVPLDVRIIGTINQKTWNNIEFVKVGSMTTVRTNNGINNVDPFANGLITYNGNVLDSTVLSSLKENKKIKNSDRITQAEIIALGAEANGLRFNGVVASYQTEYTLIDGVEGYLKYDSSKSEYDSYWNMMDIKGAKDVTIEGIGEDAGLNQWGFTWKLCSSIEVKNLTFNSATEDACAIEGGTDSTTIAGFTDGHIWIHNNTFNVGFNNLDVSSEQDKHEGDGATDIKKTAYVTLSYNRYYKTHKTGLVNGSDTQHAACITFHHNYYDQCESRLPFARQANMHMYNNYYYGSTGTNMQLYAGAYAFIEECYFENTNKTFVFKTSDGKVPAVKSYHNTFIGTSSSSGATVVQDRTTPVTNGNLYGQTFDTDKSIFYYNDETHTSDVQLLNDATDVPTFVVAHAGAGATYYNSLELYKESSVTPTPTPTDTKSITMNGKSYDTIASALAAVPTSSSATYKIVLGKGTYNENGLSYNGSATIIISGDTTTKYGTDVIIKGHGSNMAALSTRNLISFSGSGNIILENLTLESDWSRADHSGDVQAEVLGTSNTGYTAAYNCSFKSHQDTLRTTGKAWFYDCHIEGDVDFIWMEKSGVVALYENCEIVSVYDSNATNHSTYIVAPRMDFTENVGKGVVIFNSTIKEENSAQTTYLARTPWSSGYYNQAAYIKTTCTGVEAAVWYNASITTTYPKTVIGWKMDSETAQSIGYTGTEDVLDSTTVTNEFSGRKAILNRIYNTSSNAYQKDTNGYWDIDSFITTMGWTVSTDTSKDLLDGEVEAEVITYYFDGTTQADGTCYYFTGKFEGETGKFGDLTIDATKGKLAARTSDSQFNVGTKISFVATKDGSFTITNHPGYHSYTIKSGDEEAVAVSGDETTITIKSGETYVIEATATAYLYKLVIVQ